MKRLLFGVLFALLTVCFVCPAFAEPTSDAEAMSSSGDQNLLGDAEHISAEKYGFKTADNFTLTEEYESQVVKVQGMLNDLSPEVALLRGMSGNTIMKGNDKTFPRLTDVALSVMDNLLGIAKNYEPLNNQRTFSLIEDLEQRLDKAYSYQFGPDRLEKFDIELVSNEGKGLVDILIRYDDGVDSDGNAIRVPVMQEVRYAVTPGLSATKQDEREVVIVDRLPDGEYKVALGIFYAGQNRVTMEWDPRTYSRVDWLLDYHNACEDQKKWLECAKSQCVKYSQNKTVTEK